MCDKLTPPIAIQRAVYRFLLLLCRLPGNRPMAPVLYKAIVSKRGACPMEFDYGTWIMSVYLKGMYELRIQIHNNFEHAAAFLVYKDLPFRTIYTNNRGGLCMYRTTSKRAHVLPVPAKWLYGGGEHENNTNTP